MATYLDNNASALMPQSVVDEMAVWCNRGCPSSGHASAEEAAKMLRSFKRLIYSKLHLEENAHEIIFGSGAAEANSHIITACVRAYGAKTRTIPHIVTSNAEHPSVIECCRQLESEKMCQLSVLSVETGTGVVNPEEFRKALRPNTCLATIIAASHVTGAISNLKKLASYARERQVPFHCDAAQMVGRELFRPETLGLDAFSVSFHKMGGPPGTGFLSVSRKLVEGFGLRALISGDEPRGLRGGGVNLPGLGASMKAFSLALDGRLDKAERLRKWRNRLKSKMEAAYPCFNYTDHPADETPSIDGGITPPPVPFAGSSKAREAIAKAAKKGPPAIFWIEPADVSAPVLCNTLLFAVRRPEFDGAKAIKLLEKRGVIVGRGWEEVLVAMKVPAPLRKTAIQISMSDTTTPEDLAKFLVQFASIFS